jgi:hypothetical protein
VNFTIYNSSKKMEEKSDKVFIEPRKTGPTNPDNGLPSTVKRLTDFMRLDLIENESAEFIGELWKKHHRTKV